MARTSIQCGMATKPLEIPASVEMRSWLAQEGKSRRCKWLLAHADDGVIWGRFEESGLVTSDEAFAATGAADPPIARLHNATLQQVRLFSKSVEIFAWRESSRDPWRARIIEEDTPGVVTHPAFDESQLLWGTRASSLPLGFTLLEHAAEGLRHAVPLEIPTTRNLATSPARLWVRSYLSPTGWARIVSSRLLRLE